MAAREDEPIEIVKRIETPQTEREEVEKKEEIVYVPEPVPVANNEEYQEKEQKSSKRILPMLFGVTSMGIIGYLGFNYLDKENENCTQSTNVNSVNTVKVDNKENTEPKEVTTYIEELAIKKDSQKIEENVIATLSAQKKQAEKQKEEEKKKNSKPIPTEPETNSLKIEKEEVIPQKEVVKEEVVIPKKEIIKEEVVVVVPKKEIIKEVVVVPKKEIKEKTNILKYETIQPRIFRVRRGDSLASIAKRFYGNPMDFKRIIRANPRIRSHKTSLRLGEKIIIPRKDNKKTRRYIIVERGNTLASISKKVYGSTDKMYKIIRANYKIKSKRSTLRLGQKVYVPK